MKPGNFAAKDFQGSPFLLVPPSEVLTAGRFECEPCPILEEEELQHSEFESGRKSNQVQKSKDFRDKIARSANHDGRAEGLNALWEHNSVIQRELASGLGTKFWKRSTKN